MTAFTRGWHEFHPLMAILKITDLNFLGWCNSLSEAFDPATRTNQNKPQHRWTAHPSVDGCQPTNGDPGGGLH
jgi:hypothetical protein